MVSQNRSASAEQQSVDFNINSNHNSYEAFLFNETTDKLMRQYANQPSNKNEDCQVPSQMQSGNLKNHRRMKSHSGSNSTINSMKKRAQSSFLHRAPKQLIELNEP